MPRLNVETKYIWVKIYDERANEYEDVEIEIVTKVELEEEGADGQYV